MECSGALVASVECGSVRLHIGLPRLGTGHVLVCSAVWLLSSLLRRHCAGLRARPQAAHTASTALQARCKLWAGAHLLWASVSRVVDPGCTCWGIFGLPDRQAFLGHICGLASLVSRHLGVASREQWQYSPGTVAGCLHVVLTCTGCWNLGDTCHLSGVTVPGAAAVRTSCVGACLCFPGLVWRCAPGAHNTSTHRASSFMPSCFWGWEGDRLEACFASGCDRLTGKQVANCVYTNPRVGSTRGWGVCRTGRTRSALQAAGRTFPLNFLPCCMLLLSCVFWWRRQTPRVVLSACGLRRGLTCGDQVHCACVTVSQDTAHLSHRMRRPQLISWAAVYYGCRESLKGCLEDRA